MPNAKVLSEKQAIVDALVERIQKAGAGIFIDYKGITVEEDTALRSELRKENIGQKGSRQDRYERTRFCS